MPLPPEVDLPPEDGETFAANALIKARAARAAGGGAALADDSGISARALGGRPGVRSARYAGEHATDEQNLALLIDELRDHEDRAVAYVCALAYVDADGEETVVEGRCEGELIDEPRGRRRLRLRPRVRARRHGPWRPAHDGGAERRREARDQPPRPGGGRTRRVLEAGGER